MKYFIIVILAFASSFNVNAQTEKASGDMLVRISEIEVYPEYLHEYLTFALNVGAESVKEEPGVIAIYPMFQQRDSCQIRILEIYTDMAAYRQHIGSPHFQTYKQGTLHMVKSLDLVNMYPMNKADMPHVFRKMADAVHNPQASTFVAKNRASNKYNTGEVYVSLLKDSGNAMIASFIFHPNSRNFWHYHPKAEQTLMVVNGEGFYQEEGKPKQIIRKGDVIVTSPNVHHWNGATSNSSIECVTVTEHSLDNHVVQLHPVSDDEYMK